MKKTIYIMIITVSILLIGCGKTENRTTYEHTDSFVQLEMPNNESDSSYQEESTQVNEDNTVDETVDETVKPTENPSTNTNYDEEREKLMQWIKEDTQRVVDSVKENTLAGPPSYTELTTEDFDVHCEIRHYDEIDKEKLEVFIMAGYPDKFLDLFSTFVEECNIDTKVTFSTEATDLRLQGYYSIIVFANNTNYFICYNDTEMLVKEI